MPACTANALTNTLSLSFSSSVLVVELGFIRAGAAALLSADGQLREAALALLLEVARCVDFDAVPAALDDFRHPQLAQRLAALRAAFAALPPDEAEGAAEEATLAEAQHRMLQPADATQLGC